MTIAEKVGQLFTIGITGTEINGEIIHLLKNYHVGGVYYKEENVKHPKQMHYFSYRLQSYNSSHHPLFIATKQNGGHFNSIKNHTTPGLQPIDLGRLHNRVYTKRMAEYIGKELYGMGINMNLGPMLHASEEKPSSYSANLDFVAKHARAAIEGFQSENILTAVGSFPTDKETIYTNTPIYKTALHPYDYVIEHGVKAISTKDAKACTTVLRDTLQFDGIIIQDYTEKMPSTSQEVINAIKAGADIILLTETYETQMNIMNGVIEAVRAEEISESMIDAALERIFLLKSQFIVKEMPVYNRDLFKSEKSIKFMKQMEDKLDSVIGSLG